MNPIDPSFYMQPNQQNRAPSPELGKNEFLKILMTQLQNQDPLDPMDDKDFIAQMATFSQLEQMMAMTQSIELLVDNQMISPVIKYSHMIGQEVSYEKYNEETGRVEGIETSTVVSVTQKDGWAILKLANGEEVIADAILETSTPKNDSAGSDESEADDSEPDES